MICPTNHKGRRIDHSEYLQTKKEWNPAKRDRIGGESEGSGCYVRIIQEYEKKEEERVECEYTNTRIQISNR